MLEFAAMDTMRKIITFQDVNELHVRGVAAWQRLTEITGHSVEEVRRLCEEGRLDQDERAVTVFREMMHIAGLATW
jgi:hypothetical protein